MHETVQGLHAGGLIDAIIINTSAATVRAWEAGTKNPGGPSCKLLEVLDRKGIGSFTVILFDSERLCH